MTEPKTSRTPFVDSKIVEQQKRGHIVRTQYNVPVEMVFAEDARRLEEVKNQLEEAIKSMLPDWEIPPDEYHGRVACEITNGDVRKAIAALKAARELKLVNKKISLLRQVKYFTQEMIMQLVDNSLKLENPKIRFGIIGAMKLQKTHIETEWNEGHPDSGGDGYWVSLKIGWKSADDPIGCVHCIHEDSRRECYAIGVLPCDCKECVPHNHRIE